MNENERKSIYLCREMNNTKAMYTHSLEYVTAFSLFLDSSLGLFGPLSLSPHSVRSPPYILMILPQNITLPFTSHIKSM